MLARSVAVNSGGLLVNATGISLASLVTTSRLTRKLPRRDALVVDSLAFPTGVFGAPREIKSLGSMKADAENGMT